MTEVDAQPAALAELKRFLAFLGGMWGLLAGISTLFPLSNLLVKVVPLGSWPGGGLVYLPAGALSMAATLCALFVLLWTFGQRTAAKRWSRPAVHRKAWRSFALGFLALLLYLAVYFALAHNFYWIVLGWESNALRRILGDVLLLVLYAGIFSLLTRAFVLLALIEYVQPRR